MKPVTAAPGVLPHQVALLLGAALASSVCRAEPARPAESLESVVITASRSDTALADMPLHTSVVTREEIDASPARSLDQLLRGVQGFNFTGVPATQSDPTGHQTKMRGLGNAKVLVLLDGVPIHDPFYLTTQWFKVPLAGIERVEVMRGGSSSLWGNMAVAGVVNIVSREVREDAAEVTVSGGSFGSAMVAATGSLALGDRWSVTLTGDRTRANGYQTTPAGYLWRFPQKEAADADDSNVSFTTRYRDDSGLRAFARLGFHVQDQDINYRDGSNVQRSPDLALGLTQRLASGARFDANAWAQQVRFEKHNGASCYFQSAGPPAGARCPSTNAVAAAQVNGSVLQYFTQYGSLRYREQGASTSYTQPFQGWVRDVSAGIDYRRLSATDRETFYSAPTELASPQGNLGSRTFGRGTQEFTGVFVRTRVIPLEPLEVTLSARLDSWRNSDRVTTRTTAAGATTGGPAPDASRNAFDPSVALRMPLSSHLDVRGAAYRSFRAPGFNNTLRTFGATTPTIANPDLGPEKMRGWEVGLDGRWDALSASATFYRYDLRDQIATFRVNTYATAPDPVRAICSSGGANLASCGGSANFYTNDQDGQSHGVELEAEWRVSGSLQVGADYMRTSATLTRRGAVVTDPLNVQLVGVPRDVGVLRAMWKPVARLQMRGEVRYVGRMPIDTTSIAGMVFEQGGFAVANASASFAWNDSLDLFGSVVNLLDREYSEGGYTYNQPFNRTLSAPRTFNAGVRMRF